MKLFCLATNDVMIARSEKGVLSDIDRLKANAVSGEEIGRARRRYKRDVLEGLSTNLGRARFLADVWASGRDFGGHNTLSIGRTGPTPPPVRRSPAAGSPTTTNVDMGDVGSATVGGGDTDRPVVQKGTESQPVV